MNRFKLLAILLLALLLAELTAAAPAARAQAVEYDFYPIEKVCEGAAHCEIVDLINVGGRQFFIEDRYDSAPALWVSDGTEEGTQPLRSFPSSPPGYPDPYYFSLRFEGSYLKVGSELLFFAPDGQGGMGLWRTDGTTDGTFLVQPGVNGQLVAFQQKVYFLSGAHILEPTEFWTTDGTPAGTYKIQAFEGTVQWTAAQNADRLFVLVKKPAGGELWMTDGSGFDKIHTFVSLYRPSKPVFYQGALFFIDGSNLWKSDGLAGGTQIAAAIPSSDSVSELAVANGLLFFVAPNQIEYGGEPDVPMPVVWQYDGTSETTQPITDTALGRHPRRLTTFNDTLFFIGSPPYATFEYLYKTRGRTGGEDSLTEFASADEDTDPYTFEPMQIIGNRLYFARCCAPDPYTGFYWAVTDGETVVNLWPDGYFYTDPGPLVPFLGALFFSATGPAPDYDRELWASDGEDTIPIVDLVVGAGSYPAKLTVSGARMFFVV